MKFCCQCDDQCSDEHGGRWHGHYYVYYKNPRTWKEIKDHYGQDCHVEIPKSNSAVIQYVMGKAEHAEKKSNIVSYGVEPCDNGKHISVASALNMTESELRELENHKDVITVMKVREIFDDGIDLDDWYKDIKVTYICGPSGVGKSLTAKNLLVEEGFKKAHIVKHENNFWHGVGNGQGAAIYDDFRDSHMPASEFINFIDYNKHSLNVKNGSTMNNFSRIIITSVQRPATIYRNMAEEPRQQWLRRIEIIDLYGETSETSFESLLD